MVRLPELRSRIALRESSLGSRSYRMSSFGSIQRPLHLISAVPHLVQHVFTCMSDIFKRDLQETRCRPRRQSHRNTDRNSRKVDAGSFQTISRSRTQNYVRDGLNIEPVVPPESQRIPPARTVRNGLKVSISEQRSCRSMCSRLRDELLQLQIVPKRSLASSEKNCPVTANIREDWAFARARTRTALDGTALPASR